MLGVALQLAGLVGPKLVEMVAGEKAGKVAQGVANAAMQVTGAVTPDAALAALQADPQLALAYKQKIAEQEAQLEAAYLADIQNARARDVQLKKMGYSNTRADVMVGMAFICLCVIIAVLWNKPDIPGSVLAIFNMAVGYILKMLSDAFQFEFGSSRGSREKSLKMGEMP